jgi:hypothetical protein
LSVHHSNFSDDDHRRFSAFCREVVGRVNFCVRKHLLITSSQVIFRMGVIFSIFLLMLLSGCQGTTVVGLRPEYPPVEIKAFSLYGEFVEVDSLQPTFRWQAFPLSVKKEATEKATRNGEIEHVTYEIRIWRTTTDATGKLQYARSGLTGVHHRLETPLKPGTRYFWSVRAHFIVNGHPRTIEWSMAGYALRNETVPNESCLRFRTPPPH